MLQNVSQAIAFDLGHRSSFGTYYRGSAASHRVAGSLSH